MQHPALSALAKQTNFWGYCASISMLSGFAIQELEFVHVAFVPVAECSRHVLMTMPCVLDYELHVTGLVATCTPGARGNRVEVFPLPDALSCDTSRILHTYPFMQHHDIANVHA